MSGLLVTNYMADDGLKKRARALGVLGIEIHDMIMNIVNLQVCFCDQVGGNAFRLNESYEVFDDLEKKLY